SGPLPTRRRLAIDSSGSAKTASTRDWTMSRSSSSGATRLQDASAGNRRTRSQRAIRRMFVSLEAKHGQADKGLDRQHVGEVDEERADDGNDQERLGGGAVS